MLRVDFHAHVLPGLDDGPATLAESVRMAEAALRDGTSTIVATPHQRDVMLKSSSERVRELAPEVEAALAAASGGRGGGQLRVLLGMECHIEPDLPAWVSEGRALTLNGTRFILAEPPLTGWPAYVDSVLGRLLAMGLTPVLAHPERNVTLQGDPNRLRRMVDDGLLVQVTAGSFLSAYGAAAMQAATSWLKRGLVHYVASDMHSLTGPRSPRLSEAHERVASLAGADAARRLFETNPRRLVDGLRP